MKKIYLVRHGETEANVKRVLQGPDLPLTQRGEKQATEVAKRLTHLQFQTLISSPFLRARQTVQAVAEACNKEVEFLDLFREIQPPAHFFGMSWESEEYCAYVEEEKKNRHSHEWYSQDTESFLARVDRANQALSFLESHESDEIVVVTHGTFLKLLTCCAVFAGKVTPEMWDTWKLAYEFDNTGISLLEYNGERWRIRILNDHAHFAE